MQIQFTDIIDLTHPIRQDMPHWPGDPQTLISPISQIKRDGFALNSISIGEHSGTHISSASHFSSDGLTIDQMPLQNMILPAMKIDMSSTAHAEFLLSVADILQYEQSFGPVPCQSAVFLQTGWSNRWHDADFYFNNGKFPGYSLEAAEFLLSERHVVCLGIDSPGIDGFESQLFKVNQFVAKSSGFHVENLCNLEKIPRPHFSVFIGVLPIVGGHGSPCRILCLQ